MTRWGSILFVTADCSHLFVRVNVVVDVEKVGPPVLLTVLRQQRPRLERAGSDVTHVGQQSGGRHQHKHVRWRKPGAIETR